MKTRLQVAGGEKIEHVGDLTIEQDIGDGAELKITNGSLTIKGNIGHNAKIELIAPENKKTQEIDYGANIYSGISYASGGVSITTTRGGFTNSVRADMMINNNNYIGNVNINNRIYSNDQVSKISNDSYKIIPSQYSKPRGTIAHATIDGIEYKGSEIVVKGKEVLVDGKKPGGPITASAPEPELPPAKLVIHGSIGNHVTLISGAETNVIEQNIGSECKIHCKQGELKAKDVGNGTHITAHHNIALDQIASGCHLTSATGSLTATRIGPNARVKTREKIDAKDAVGAFSHIESSQGSLNTAQIENNVTVHVRKEIEAKIIGHNNTLTSEQSGLFASALGQNATVQVRKDIKVDHVGKSSHLTSDQGRFLAQLIEEKVNIKVRASAEINEVRDRCRITSEQGIIYVYQVAGNNTLLEARGKIFVATLGNENKLNSEQNEIEVKKTGINNQITARQNIYVDTLGSDCTLESGQGGVRVSGLSGNHVSIEARQNIELNHIGSHAKITSHQNTVTTGNVGSSPTINARKDININGSCPRYSHIESSQGRVYKNGPIQEYKHVEAIDEDTQLELAVAQSLQESKPVAPNMSDISKFDLSQFSEYTRAYIQSFAHIEKNSLKVEALKLSKQEEEGLLESLVDVLTLELPEIPVRLNEKLYDLKTLVFDLPKKGEDPFTRFKFKLEHIMPAHDIQEKLEKRIKKIETDRANAKAKTSEMSLSISGALQAFSQIFSQDKLKENDRAIQKENDVAARKASK